MMKKIFLTVMAAVAMVGAANAATTWQFSGVANPDYGYAFLFTSGEADVVAGYFDGYIEGDELGYGDAVSVLKYEYSAKVDFTDGSGSGVYDFSEDDRIGIVFVDDPTAPTKYMATESVSVSQYIQQYENGFDMSDVGWTALTVPEPTSWLLMLVGLAGIALKRRRA